jgi:hypothetical protein
MIPNKMRIVGLDDPKYFYRLDGPENNTEAIGTKKVAVT